MYSIYSWVSKTLFQCEGKNLFTQHWLIVTTSIICKINFFIAPKHRNNCFQFQMITQNHNYRPWLTLNATWAITFLFASLVSSFLCLNHTCIYNQESKSNMLQALILASCLKISENQGICTKLKCIHLELALPA